MNDDMTRDRATPAEGGAASTRDRATPVDGGAASRAKSLLSLATQLRQSLQGAVFPLSRSQLVRVARENAAPAELLTVLAGLPRGEFRSLEAVEFALRGS